MYRYVYVLYSLYKKKNSKLLFYINIRQPTITDNIKTEYKATKKC